MIYRVGSSNLTKQEIKVIKRQEAEDRNAAYQGLSEAEKKKVNPKKFED